MKKEEKKPFIQCCILGAIGGILMTAGDWLLGCVPLQETDTGMFDRAYHLSGVYALWKPALVIRLGAIGRFLYAFMVKALNTDIDARHQRTKTVQYLCGIFTVVVALAIHFVMLLAGKTRYPRWMLVFHPVTWNLLLVAVPDIAQAMQVPAATWMSVMSQSSTNSAIVIWCIAAAVYERSHT